MQLIASTAPANEDLRSTKKPVSHEKPPPQIRIRNRASSSPSPQTRKDSAAATTPSPRKAEKGFQIQTKSSEVVVDDDDEPNAGEKFFENEILPSEGDTKLSNKVGF